MTRIELICIWTFKIERRRFANKSCTACASGIAIVSFWHLADIGFDAEHVRFRVQSGLP